MSRYPKHLLTLSPLLHPMCELSVSGLAVTRRAVAIDGALAFVRRTRACRGFATVTVAVVPVNGGFLDETSIVATRCIMGSGSRSRIAHITPGILTTRSPEVGSPSSMPARVFEAALTPPAELRGAVAGQPEMIFNVWDERMVGTPVGPQVLQRILCSVAQKPDRGLGIRVGLVVTVELVLGLTESDDQAIDVRLDADSVTGRAGSPRRVSSARCTWASMTSAGVDGGAGSSAYAFSVTNSAS
ncbi:hypothetical protein BO99DRAFT_15687 [Aspergillus violaceofuscus CBS 115571]|uniref:Uncharacterized protein n=1 Tax=Aspergillus violaceofuscus (strain CBS 115571) TaxID=1450538 RepID=A0A2V5HRT0_ASPV1|nr:hypothetical protein BO99DRAFT_15687 [Aspergillus violaceofuscus CBS 115571]